jgi:hypothetical protein
MLMGVFIALAVIAITGYAVADIPVNATPETKGITVTTSVNAQGTVTATDSLTWQQSNDALNAPPLIWGGNQGGTDDLYTTSDPKCSTPRDIPRQPSRSRV